MAKGKVGIVGLGIMGGGRYTAGAAAFKLNVTARRSARALSFSRAHNPVWSPPAAGTLPQG